MQLGSTLGQSYKPFLYPPDYELARRYKQASRPGIPDKNQAPCIVSNQPLKTPFKNWWTRSIQNDFKHYGGAVVGYFWLIRLYILASLAVGVVYAAYLQYITYHFCQLQHADVRELKCGKIFGIWIVSNEDLYKLIDKTQGQEATLVRFLTLRGVAFLILLTTNLISLYLIKWFKVRYPDKPSVSDFALLFKNLRNDKVQDLLDKLYKQFGQFDIKQAFIIKKVQPFYTTYQQKLELYYQCRIQKQAKKYKKMMQKLHKLDKVCSQSQQSFYNSGNRAIVVFKSQQIRQNIRKKYSISKIHKLRMFLSAQFEQTHGIYCESCPRSEEIIWKNIGLVQKQGFIAKLLSVVYFFFIVGLLSFITIFFLDIVYVQDISEPYKTLIVNFVLLFIVFIALTFRQLMNRLSQMRFPGTYTSRSMFIIITTTLFHLITYVIVPSLFLWLYKDKRGDILTLICTQSVNFIIVHILIAGYDLMYCCWNKNLKKIQDQDRPIGCQKILNQKMQFPRFPIQFKLIILFKIWSFITLFAFHVPLILFLIFVFLVFLYIKDKKNVYYHYRMQVLHNDVQFNFLRVYSNIFSLYLFTAFIFTKDSFYQQVFAGVCTIIAVICQTFLFQKPKEEQLQENQRQYMSLDDLQDHPSYESMYQKFLDQARSDLVDNQIRQYLSKYGYGTMKTQQNSLLQKFSDH